MKKMIGFIVVLISVTSCIPKKTISEEQERVFITIDGHPVELVVDEYDNPYLKQKTACGIVYIPFTFPTEEDEIPQIYEIKNSNHGTSK